jgi:hypothetical protein
MAFGLVRTRPQVERAESSDAAFEHYRNDTAADAHTRIQSHGFTLLERCEVGPGTSNQWVLRYGTPSAPTDTTPIFDAE